MNLRGFLWALAHYLVCLGFFAWADPQPWFGVWGLVAIVGVAYFPLRQELLNMGRQEAAIKAWVWHRRQEAAIKAWYDT